MFVMQAIAAVLLAGGFLVWLMGAGYSRAATVLLAATVLAEAGPLMAMRTGQSLWLAVGVLAVAMSAEAFAKRADARRIILFGGSLAAIQLLDPLGGIVAAGLLPATLAIGRGRAEARQMAGLFALLMFMPVMMALLLLYLTRIQHIDPAGLFVGPAPAVAARAFIVHAGLPWSLAPIAGFALIVGPALLAPGRARGVSRSAVALAAFGVTAAATAGALLGVIRESVTFLAAAAPVVAAALAQRPASSTRSHDAAVIALICTGLSWVVFIVLTPQASAGW